MTTQISLESLNLSWMHRILLYSFCLARNSLPELISGGGVGIRMSWVENFLKINKGASIRDQRVDKPGFSEKKPGLSNCGDFHMPQFQINQIFLQKSEVSSDKPGLSGEKLGLSGEKLGLSEKNLVYLIVVIFACHKRGLNPFEKP